MRPRFAASVDVNLLQRIRRFLDDLPGDRRRALRDTRPLDAGMLEIDGRPVADFASNDYLGLSRHPQLIERSAAWARECGAGSRASRLVSGNLPGLGRLEQRLAKLKGVPSCLIFGTGFQVNSSVLAALVDRQLQNVPPSSTIRVFSDRLCHASFHFGLAAAGVRQHRFQHNDLNHLERLLKKHVQPSDAVLIATESVFSMDGDRLDVTGIRHLARQFDALLYVDEAHATGVLGDAGMGLMAGGESSEREVVIGTFGKAMGSFGSYVACSKTVREFLVNRCAGLIYSTALPPTVLGSIDAALDLVPSLDRQRRRLQELAGHLRGELGAGGLDTLASDTHIVPVVIGDDRKLMRLAAGLLSDGFLVGAIRSPTVPAPTCRLRLCVSAAHDEARIEALAAAVIRLATGEEPS